MVKQPILVLYNPVLHGGYLKLYKKYASKVSALYLLGEDILADFPETMREVAVIDPATMAEAIRGLSMFKEVNILSKADLKKLNGQPLIADDHTVTKWALGAFLPHSEVTFDTTFLRWDMPKALSKNPVKDTAKVSQKEFDREMIALAQKEAEKSPDWWRQVGAVAWKDGQVLFVAHNDHLPSRHVSYAEGDPRAWFNAGEHTDASVAIHAEQSLIAEAARTGVSLEGASLYVTTFPCPTCANLVAFSGITKCYFHTGYSLVNGRRVLDAFNVEIIRVVLPAETGKED